MSIERQVRVAVLEAAVGRILTEAIGIFGRVFLALGRGFEEIADGPFYIELDAARRYKLLTGADLGSGAGDDHRHEMTPEPITETEDEEE